MLLLYAEPTDHVDLLNSAVGRKPFGSGPPPVAEKLLSGTAAESLIRDALLCGGPQETFPRWRAVGRKPDGSGPPPSLLAGPRVKKHVAGSRSLEETFPLTQDGGRWAASLTGAARPLHHSQVGGRWAALPEDECERPSARHGPSAPDPPTRNRGGRS